MFAWIATRTGVQLPSPPVRLLSITYAPKVAVLGTKVGTCPPTFKLEFTVCRAGDELYSFSEPETAWTTPLLPFTKMSLFRRLHNASSSKTIRVICRLSPVPAPEKRSQFHAALPNFFD